MKYLQSKSVFEHLKTFESLSVDKGFSVLHVGETNRLWAINRDINLANLIIIYR